MSADDKDESALVPRPDDSIATPTVKPTRVLREMIAVSVARTEGSVVAPGDLDILVQEAKELYLSQGEGMTNENTRAFTLFHRAALQGHGEAKHYLSQMYELGDGVNEDPVEAMKWTCAAAEAGIGPSQYVLGVTYISGDGMPRDEAEGVRWLRKAAEQNAAERGNEWEVAKREAQYCLAVCYENGCGVPKDDAEAVKWLKRTTEEGPHAKAIYDLGCRYCDGRGVSKDLLRGYACLQFAAADLDFNPAKERVAALKAQLSPSEFDSISRIYREARE